MQQLEIEPVFKKMPDLVGRRKANAVGSIAPGTLAVFVNEETLEQILQYSERDKQREIGGFLIGNLYRDNYPYLHLKHFLPAANTNSRPGSVTFTHETWQRLNQQIEASFPNERVIGWHHTHPSMGIFLSSYDRFIHENFFGQPWQIAMVVDPCQQQFGIFQWNVGDGQRELINNGFVVVPDKKQKRRLRNYNTEG